MAVDLREIVGAIRVAGDLERVGDLAKNIAKRSLKIGGEPRVPRAIVGLKHMNDVATELHEGRARRLRAARRRAGAGGLGARRGARRARGFSVFRDLLTHMMEDPRNISYCAHLLFCSKNVERIGDHATNIAETVFYLVTGATLPVERPKGRTDSDLEATESASAVNETRRETARSRRVQAAAHPRRRGRSRPRAAADLQSRGGRLSRPRASSAATKPSCGSSKRRPIWSSSIGCCRASRASKSAGACARAKRPAPCRSSC